MKFRIRPEISKNFRLCHIHEKLEFLNKNDHQDAQFSRVLGYDSILRRKWILFLGKY